MDETLQFLERYGYWIIAAAILGRQACLPVPANLFLLAAGALARSRKLDIAETIAISVFTFLVADLAWYATGWRFGGRILHLVCAFSGDPARCARRATSTFTSHRVRTLLTSKFVVGLDAVCAPLAGSTGFPLAMFVVLDAIGAAFWTSCYLAVGYVFRDQLNFVATCLLKLGTLFAILAAAAFGFYILRRFLKWQHFLRQFRLARITPEQLRAQLDAGENILLIDLRRPQNHTMEAIPGAIRINPRQLEQYRDVQILPSQEIVLYCDSSGEFTSARVALALRRRGIENVRPLAGGLRAWLDLGYPVTQSRNPQT